MKVSTFSNFESIIKNYGGVDYIFNSYYKLSLKQTEKSSITYSP